MSSVVISGNTSGTITLDAPAVAGTTTLTLPATSGTVALTASPTFTGQATIPTINLTGGQITFPATAVPSADANTLDDYEEGTWTPVYAFSTSGSVTQAITSGRYTKVGDVVHLFCRIATSALSSPTGVATISGLPFTSGSGSNYGVAVGQASGWASDLTIRAQLEASASIISILKNTSSAAGTSLQGSDFASGGNKNLLDITLTYKTA
jgi:hypothetical protein